MKNKKKISPTIKIVLIFVAVIILVILFLLWVRGSGPPQIVVEDMYAEEACQNAAFESDYNPSNSEITITNTGDVDIYEFEVRFYLDTGTNVQELAINLPQGDSGSSDIDVGDATKIKLTPILLGKMEERDVSYLCKNHPGEEIAIK